MAVAMRNTATPTAGLLIIGDEILSGRTKDRNIGFVADLLTNLAIDLCEVRVVADREQAIIDAVNALRSTYTYVFTSGGIGPTHDDITAQSIAAAFGLPCIHDERAMALLEAHYARQNMEFTDARKRMARMPKGASLIDNPVSIAPGFRIENVHVMAGVPKIMQAMMDAIAPTLKGGTKMLSRHVDCDFGEGTIGGPLGDIQDAHPQIMIGSYPRFDEGNYSTQIVVRGRDQTLVDTAIEAVEALIRQLRSDLRR